MKKTVKTMLLALVLVICMCCSALAITQSDIQGVWDVDLKPIMVEQGIPEDQIDVFMQVVGGMSMTIEFTADQKFVMETVVGGEAEREEYPYQLQGNMVVLEDGTRSEVIVDGETLTILDPDGTRMVLTRHGAADTGAVTADGVVGVWNMDINAILMMSGMSQEEYDQVAPFMSLVTGTMEFTADGRAILLITVLGEEADREEYTYSVDGTTMYMNDGEAQYTLEGDTLTIYGQNGMNLTLTRNDAAAPVIPTATVAPVAQNSNSVVGVWAMDVMEMMRLGGASEEELAQMEPLVGLMTATMEFTADGRVIINISALGTTDTQETTYVVEGDQIIIEGDPATYTINGDTMIIEAEDVTFTLTRQ